MFQIPIVTGHDKKFGKHKIINKNFGEVFAELFGGGKAELTLTDEENVLECGIVINEKNSGELILRHSMLFYYAFQEVPDL